MVNSIHTTQDTKKNGNHLNVGLETKTAFFTVSLSQETTLKYYNLVNKATDDRKMCAKKEAELVVLGNKLFFCLRPLKFGVLEKQWENDKNIGPKIF